MTEMLAHSAFGNSLLKTRSQAKLEDDIEISLSNIKRAYVINSEPVGEKMHGDAV